MWLDFLKFAIRFKLQRFLSIKSRDSQPWCIACFSVSSSQRKSGDCLEKQIIQGTLPGNRTVVGSPAGPAMVWPLFLPRKFILVFFAFYNHSPTSPLRQHLGTTWPDHFSKADYDPGKEKETKTRHMLECEHSSKYQAHARMTSAASGEASTLKSGDRLSRVRPPLPRGRHIGLHNS